MVDGKQAKSSLTTKDERGVDDGHCGGVPDTARLAGIIDMAPQPTTCAPTLQSILT